MKDKVELLAHCSLFENVPEEQLKLIASALTSHTFREGDVIIQEGDIGDCIYFIEDGSVNVVKEKVDGSQVHIATLNNNHFFNEYFGEMAIVTNTPRSSTVIAATDCQLVSLDKDTFQKLQSENITISLALNKVLAERLSATLNIIREVSNAVMRVY